MRFLETLTTIKSQQPHCALPRSSCSYLPTSTVFHEADYPLYHNTISQITETLGTEKTRPSIAAQCVASVACVELPRGLWPEVISMLMTNVSDQSSESLKESSLEAIGYICQDIVGYCSLLVRNM